MHSNNLTGTLMSSNAMRGIGHLDAESSPFVVQEGLVRCAQPGPVDFDEDLA